MTLRALFITRNYPPKVGGLEEYSYNLIKEFETNDVTYKIVLTKSNIHLVWFFIYCFLKALYIIWRYAVRSIHLCDGLLSPVGIGLKILTGARISVSIHGLDITYKSSLYQRIIPRCVSRLDKIICVSRSTREECLRRGVPCHKCTVIPNGIRPNEFYLAQPKEQLRSRVEKLIGMSIRNKIVLLTIGRLVQRKGVSWFIKNVMPRLDLSYHYLIVGDGPEYEYIEEAVKHHNLQNRVSVIGRVSNEERNVIYNASDIFVMPNITVFDDVEGFGIVAIEAGSCGLPVIASNIQGIRDAVLDGRTGYLVEERDVDGFLRKINETNLKKENVRSIVNSTFDWTQIYKRYRDVLLNL